MKIPLNKSIISPVEKLVKIEAAIACQGYLEEISKFKLCQCCDEVLMRSFEDSVDIPEQSAADFRYSVLANLAAQFILS